jgi:hypothetical protein
MNRYLGLILLLFGSLAHAWEAKPNCDNPSPIVKDSKASGLEDCQEQCEQVAQCKAIVFVSGWKKCWLKGAVKQASLRFISGELSAGRYEQGHYQVDNDHTGKDLKREVLATPDECGKACESNTDCRAFTYLEGYKVCWLKKAGGRFLPKIFYCAAR